MLPRNARILISVYAYIHWARYKREQIVMFTNSSINFLLTANFRLFRTLFLKHERYCWYSISIQTFDISTLFILSFQYQKLRCVIHANQHKNTNLDVFGTNEKEETKSIFNENQPFYFVLNRVPWAKTLAKVERSLSWNLMKVKIIYLVFYIACLLSSLIR